MSIKKTLASLVLAGTATLGSISGAKASTLEIQAASPVRLYDTDGVTELPSNTTHLYENQIIDFDLHIFSDGGRRAFNTPCVSLNEPEFIEGEGTLKQQLNDQEFIYNIHWGVEHDWNGQNSILGTVEDYFTGELYNTPALGTYFFNTPTPDPSTLSLLGAGFAGLALSKRRKSKALTQN